jgi:hypothetical protein
MKTEQIIEFQKTACSDGVKYFIDNNYHLIDYTKIKEIICNSRTVFEYFKWLIPKLKIAIILKYEDSNGYWKKRKYNAKGLETKYEDSNGCWEKWEYNAKGLETKYEDSNGYWKKRKYNEDNTIKNIEISNYEKKPKCKFIESEE